MHYTIAFVEGRHHYTLTRMDLLSWVGSEHGGPSWLGLVLRGWELSRPKETTYLLELRRGQCFGIVASGMLLYLYYFHHKEKPFAKFDSRRVAIRVLTSGCTSTLDWRA